MSSNKKHYSLWLTSSRLSQLSQKLQSISNILSDRNNVQYLTTHITLNTFYVDDQQLQHYIQQYDNLFNNDTSYSYSLHVTSKTLAYTPNKAFMTIFALIERNLQLLNLKHKVEQIVNNNNYELSQQAVDSYTPHISLLYDTYNKINAIQRNQQVNELGIEILYNLLLTIDTIELYCCNDQVNYNQWYKVKEYQLKPLYITFYNTPTIELPLIDPITILLTTQNKSIIQDNTTHELYIDNVIELSKLATTYATLPFTCLLVIDGVVVLTSMSTVVTTRDIYKHAEYNMLQQAFKYFNKHQIESSILYCSVEPCAGCNAFLASSGIKHIVYSMSKHSLSQFWPVELSSSQMIINKQSVISSIVDNTISNLTQYNNVVGDSTTSLNCININVIGPINEQQTIDIFKGFAAKCPALIQGLKIE